MCADKARMAAVSPEALALNRFGLGARPDETPPTNPRNWLLDQFARFDVRPAAFVALPDASSLYRAYADEQAMQRQTRQESAGTNVDPRQDPAMRDARKDIRVQIRDAYRGAVNARLASALITQAPFVERLTHFWANHFALSVEKPQVSIYAGAYEADAIRPHVLGRFEDMLLAVERHPAMLFYLDQFRSVGPDSRAALLVAERRPDRILGLNENLAREIMELHTLGVRTGYSQADVTEFARALTGWSVGGVGPQAGRDGGNVGGFLFRPGIHEPGSRTIMGKTYADEGEGQARSLLQDLAASPATARHISTKLARHFVADDPPPALIDRLAASFLKSGGDLPTLYRTLVEAPEAWIGAAPKFKSPWDWTVSALRGLGRRDIGKIDAAPMLNQLGQPVWRPGSPAGYDDITATWAAPDALMRRVELAQRFAQGAGGQIDARALAPHLLPGTVSVETTTALAQADSGVTALALLLVSPDFQRR